MSSRLPPLAQLRASDASDASDAYLLLVLRPVRWSAAGNPRGAPALSTSGSWPCRNVPACRCLSSSWRFSHIMPIRSRCGHNSIVSPSRLLNHSSNTRRLSLSFRNSIPPISPIPMTPLFRPRSGRSRSSPDQFDPFPGNFNVLLTHYCEFSSFLRKRRPLRPFVYIYEIH